MTFSDPVDVSGMFRALLENVYRDPPEHRYRPISEHAHGSVQAAMAYVWGAEDHGSPVIMAVYGRTIISASWEFGYMYGLVDLLYQSEVIWSMPSIRDAFVAFRNSRDLREYPYEWEGK